ncbi:sporulation histidine kinase inhibitor Sda [Bacillus sp. CGMCC 1.16607]|uniref:sporulation histidine kinase inhibitor Sda n=1 Tax=Bacillus sp. CGMCC 1.16607 TaxID=3351842 RepID=UPI00362F8DD9
MSWQNKIDDSMLIKIYFEAKKKHVDQSFLDLIINEINVRGILVTRKSEHFVQIHDYIMEEQHEIIKI